MNNIITAIPLKAENLYLLKSGTMKNKTVAKEDMLNAVHNNPG